MAAIRAVLANRGKGCGAIWGGYGVRLRVTIGDRVTTLYSDVGTKTISQKDHSIAPISSLIYKKSGCQIIQFPVKKGNLGPLRVSAGM